MNNKILLHLAGAVVAAALLLACGTGATPDGSPTDQPEGKPTATTIVVPQTAPSAAPSSAAPVKTITVVTFGDGIWQVPEDVKPGTYKTVVPSGSWNCYYEIKRDFDNEIDSIIDNGNQAAGKQVVIVIGKAAKGLEVSGCGTWTKVK